MQAILDRLTLLSPLVFAPLHTARHMEGGNVALLSVCRPSLFSNMRGSTHQAQGSENEL